jgi:glycosyltransferase involved in cell wall biosynthesis
LVKRGHEITVLTAHFNGLPREENIAGIRVIRLASLRQKPYEASLVAMSAFLLSGFLAALRLANHWKPDLIHVHFAVPAGAIAWGLSRLTATPYILTAHLGDVPGGVPEKTSQWFRWIYPFTPPIWRHARRVVTVSEYTRQIALQNYPVQMQVIHNGVDLSSFQPAEIQVNDPPRLVFAGRFTEQKNPLQLIETLAQLQDLPWSCAMIGDGPLRPQVERKIEACGLQSRFALPGWITPEEVIGWLAKSDILFMPSLSEGLPVVGVQSLAMGLAVVTSCVGGFVDLVNPEKNGYLIQGQDTDAYARALRGLLSRPERLYAFRKASREKAKEFDLTKIVNEYEELILEIAREG